MNIDKDKLFARIVKDAEAGFDGNEGAGCSGMTTRIAPSPTGMFHIGSARTALFNWLIARSTGGKFILRIDDTDKERNTPEAVQTIFDAMSWLNLDYDITFKQSDRLSIYTDLANQLVEANLAVCDGNAVILAFKDNFESWNDTLAGEIKLTDQDWKVINNLVLVRSDGMPTYHFASVVDDMDYGISWIVRGTDHLSNTSRQIALWKTLSTLRWSGATARLPTFSHIGLITKDGKKVSKRDGAASLLGYRDNGTNPDAMCNWLLRLGWGPTVDDKTTKMIDRDRALELFLNGGKMRSSPANMDPRLLESFDRKYKGKIERENRN